MSSIKVPPAALDAGARAMCHNAYKHLPEMRDQDTYTPDAEYWLGQARAAFVAMVTAWEGAYEFKSRNGQAMALPLTENPDDKAR